MREKSLATICLFLICFSCNGRREHAPGTGGIPRIVIGRDQVYDLDGYADEGGGTPWNLFDENAYVDPRYTGSADAYIPVTNSQPTRHPEIYFGSGKGSRIVIDLRAPHALKEIDLYDRSSVNDSVWLYTGTLRQWKQVAALETVSTAGSRGWKKFQVSEETRFVMIRFSSYQTNITEMVLYGLPQQPLPPVKPVITAGSFTRKNLREFLGVNYVMENDPKWLMPFYYQRLYNVALDYDNDPGTGNDSPRFNMLHYGWYRTDQKKYVFSIDTIKNSHPGNLWFSIRGVSKQMSDRGYTEKDRPMDRAGMNSEDPASYSRHAAMMWNLAAFFGNTKVDTQRLSLSHEPKASGRGSLSLWENGNEEDAWWVGSKYCSPTEYYAQSTADWDGDEGRLGADRGIRNADPGSRLMMSGLVGLDTNRVKVYGLLCRQLRGDGRFIWQGGIQYHYYCQASGRGISPEADSLRWRLMRVRDCSRRIAPEVECFLGENGYDKNQSSRQATPLLPGHTPAESQGIMLLRSINATFFSGFDAYVLFWLKDGNAESDPGVYSTSGIMRSMPDGSERPYPAWYYISTLVKRLGAYRPDSVISEKGDVWVYRYRHLQFPDSVAYFVYVPSVNGAKRNFLLRTRTGAGHSVLQVGFRDDGDAGDERVLPVHQGAVSLSVGEEPRLIFSRESLPSS